MKNFEKIENKRLFGKLAKGTLYEQYAIQNKILDKNKNFIERKTRFKQIFVCYYLQQ